MKILGIIEIFDIFNDNLERLYIHVWYFFSYQSMQKSIKFDISQNNTANVLKSCVLKYIFLYRDSFSVTLQKQIIRFTVLIFHETNNNLWNQLTNCVRKNTNIHLMDILTFLEISPCFPSKNEYVSIFAHLVINYGSCRAKSIIQL